MLAEHEIDDELENADSNAFQKAIDQKWRGPPCVAIYSPDFGRRL